MATPIVAKPSSISAQVEGSGTPEGISGNSAYVRPLAVVKLAPGVIGVSVKKPVFDASKMALPVVSCETYARAESISPS
jgi:hypothetical protein